MAQSFHKDTRQFCIFSGYLVVNFGIVRAQICAHTIPKFTVFCSETTLRVLQSQTLVEPCPSINLSFLMTEKRCSSQKRAYNRISIRPVYTMNPRAKWRTLSSSVPPQSQAPPSSPPP